MSCIIFYPRCALPLSCLVVVFCLVSSRLRLTTSRLVSFVFRPILVFFGTVSCLLSWSFFLFDVGLTTLIGVVFLYRSKEGGDSKGPHTPFLIQMVYIHMMIPTTIALLALVIEMILTMARSVSCVGVALSCLVLSCLVLALALPCLSWLGLLCMVLSCLVLCCLALSCLLLSGLVWSGLVFSCFVSCFCLVFLPSLSVSCYCRVQVPRAFVVSCLVSCLESCLASCLVSFLYPPHPSSFSSSTNTHTTRLIQLKHSFLCWCCRTYRSYMNSTRTRFFPYRYVIHFL
jgi:hypothetical protein